MTIVFDFDKTLTDRDTLFGFYKLTNKSGFSYLIKRVLLLIAAICYKLKIISNNKLKKIGVSLFLKGKDKSFIDEKGKLYASSINLNKIYYNDYLQYSISDRIVISASLIEYLKHIFPNERIFASSLKYSESMKVIGLEENLYAEQKRIFIKQKGIERIDTLYTDSYSDKALMDISNKIFLIEKGVKRLISNG